MLEEIEKLALSSIPMTIYAPPEGVVPVKTFYMSERLNSTPSHPFVSMILHTGAPRLILLPAQLNSFLIGQDQLEGVLRSAMKKYNCEVEFGTALVSLDQTADHVSATVSKRQGENEVKVTENFDWLVGSDGAKGVVRKQLGLSFLGESSESAHIVIGDITDVEGLDVEVSLLPFPY